MKRKLLVVAGIVLALFVIAAIALPLLIDANRYKPQLESRLKSALGRNVSIGSVSVSLLSGGVKAENISIADDPAFSREPFLTAEALKIGVEMRPLIFDRKVSITSITVDKPAINLLESGNGKWNFSTLGGQKTPATGSSSQPLTVQQIDISDGKITVGRANGKRQSYTNVNVNAKDVSETQKFPFSVEANTPGGGKLKLAGTAGPLDPKDTSNTPFDAKVIVKDLDLGSTGFVAPDAGIAGVMDYEGNLESDGRTLKSDGSATAHKLRLVKGGGTAAEPVMLDYASMYDLNRQTGMVTKGIIRTGKSTANLGGTFDAHGASTTLNMKLSGKNLPMQDVQGLLPALGVTLPAGSSLQGGTASADLNLVGPVERLVTNGTVNLSNVKWAGFSLGKSMQSVAALAGLPNTSDTTIQLLSSALRVAPEGIRTDNLNMILEGIGSLTGSGTISSGGALDYKLLAKLNNAAGSPVGALTQLAGMRSGGAKSIPFLVKGTTAKPVFIPDVNGLVGSALGGQLVPGQQQNQPGVNNVINSLGGLFGKKKPK